MISVTKRIEFDAGHRVPDHASKCRSPHGHRYAVEVTVEGDVIDQPGVSDNGMVVDFGVLKEIMVRQIHDVYDHAMIVWTGDTLLLGALRQIEEWKTMAIPAVPTAENLAALFAETVGKAVAAWTPLLTLARVTVWETPTCRASWTP